MHTNNGMIYDNITKAKFIRRPNRFIAERGDLIRAEDDCGDG